MDLFWNGENFKMSAKENEIEKLVDKIKTDFSVTLSLIMDKENIRYRTEDNDAIIMDYLNFCNKWISATSRKVLYSSQLRKKFEEFDPELKNCLHYFEDMFEKGNDINGHLSRQIYSADKFDMLLNTWNIRHLHLNPRPATSDEEMKDNRSDYLLFFSICGDLVLFYDVLAHPHGAGFAPFHFLEIASSNSWLDKIGFIECKDIVDITFKVTSDEDIYKLSHKNNINLIYVILGKFYIPMGVSTMGNPISHSLALIHLNHRLYEVSEQLLNGGFVYKRVSTYRGKYYIQFEADGEEKQICITP